MKTLEIITVPIYNIISGPNQPREFFDEEEIKQMAKSVEKIGLLNPITVRKFDGKYQIIAGLRRWKVMQELGKKEIQVKVVDANDAESDVMSIAENYHRKDLTPLEREKHIYAAWKRGKDDIYNGKKSVMSEWTGIPVRTLYTIIDAGEEKDKNKSKIIQSATADDLKRTRLIKDIPEIREELLELEQKSEKDQRISAVDLEPIVKAIKTAKNRDISDDIIKDIPRLISDKKIKPGQIEDFIKVVADLPGNLQKDVIEAVVNEKKGIEPIVDLELIVRGIKAAKDTNMSEDVIKDIPKLISEKKIKSIQTEDFVKVIAEAPQDLQKEIIQMVEKEEIIETDKVKSMVNILIESQPDIQKKLLKKEIGIDDAKIANVFPREDQRNQIIEEHRMMKEENKKDIERHIKIRKRQAEEIEQGKEPKGITIADIEIFKKINANSFEQQDSRMLQFYRNQLLNLMIKADDIKSMHFDANKKEAIDIIWKIYERSYKALVELEEIKVFGNINPRRSPVPPKLYGR